MTTAPFLVVLALSFLLASCGGSSGTPAVAAAPGATTTPVAFTAARQSANLNATGGSVALTGADGTKYQLDLPAGALVGDTTLSLTTQAPGDGQQFNLLLQPAGLVFAGGNVGTLTIQLPAGTSLPTTGGLVYDGVLIPYTRLPDGRIQVSLSTFASATAVTASTVAVVAIQASDALARPRRIAAASTSVCGSAPTLQSNGGLAAVTAVDIDLYGQCMVSAVQELAVTGQFAQAVRVAQSVAAYLQATGAGNATQLQAQASSIACTAYGLALDRARTTSASGMGVLYDLVKPIMFWEKTVQQLGASCAAIAADAYQTVIHTKTGEAMAHYAQQKPDITDTTGPAYSRARTEVAQSVQATKEVLALNPPAALRSTLTAEVAQRTQPGVLDAMLQAPWLRCRNMGNYDELISLMEALGGPASVKSAAQYCGTRLDASSRNASGLAIDQLSQALGGVSAGVQRVSGSLQASKTGALSVMGPIQALRCPVSPSGSGESLVLKMDGFVFQTLVSSPFINNLSDIDIGAALEAAHPGATSGLTQAVLTVERTGSPCVGFWGPAPVPLLSLTLNFPGAVTALMLAFQPEPDGFRPGTYVEGTPVTPLVCSEGGGPCINPELRKLGSNAALPFTLAARGVVLNVTQIGPNVFAVDADVTRGQGREVKIGLQFSSVVSGRLNVEKNESWQTYPVSAGGSECVQLRDDSALNLTPGIPANVNLFVSADTVVCTHFALPAEMAGRGRMVTITFVPD